MKSFLLRGKRPIIRWSLLPNETYFEGDVPEGYNLAVSPWGDDYVVIDVDKHDGGRDGFDSIPFALEDELDKTYHYCTKNDGMHFWFRYTGNKPLGNKSSGLGIDLRTQKGYVVWYPDEDIRDVVKSGKINDTSEELNKWLEELFSYVD